MTTKYSKTILFEHHIVNPDLPKLAYARAVYRLTKYYCHYIRQDGERILKGPFSSVARAKIVWKKLYKDDHGVAPPKHRI